MSLKKILSILCAFTLLVSVMCACGGSEETVQNSSPSSSTESENKITSSMTKATEDLQRTVDGYTTTVNNQFHEIEEMLDSLDLTFDAGTSTDIEGDDITIYDGGVY